MPLGLLLPTKGNVDVYAHFRPFKALRFLGRYLLLIQFLSRPHAILACRILFYSASNSIIFTLLSY